jgi:hypothetical protein
MYNYNKKKMKYIILFFITIFFMSCGDNDQLFHKGSSEVPDNVKEVQLTPIPGGVKINYSLPETKDLLYVKAEYVKSDKSIGNVKSSLYGDTIVIKGFGDTLTKTIRLSTMTRSRVESESKEFQFNPLTPPVKVIRTTTKTLPDFGGIYFNCINKDKENLSIIFMVKDSNDIYVEEKVIYTSSDTIAYSLRGLDSVETDFKIKIRDRWDNYSDDLLVTLTPLPEAELDRTLWQQLTTPGETDLSAYDGSFRKLVDFVTNDRGNYAHTTGGHMGMYFSWDMGVKAKLSRFKTWQRAAWEWKHHGPKRFEIWGANNPNPDGSFDGWTKLIDGESKKPSGLPLGKTSDEDMAYAAAGEEFAFPIDAEPVRYLRFVMLESWSGGSNFHQGEMTAFGQIIETY